MAAAAALLIVGCSSKLESGTPAYKAGELGNGGFEFTCDDSVACNKFNAAATFPNTVARGASFRVKYVPRDARTNEPGSSAGVTTSAVGNTYLSYGPDGFVGVKAGLGTITARNAQGQLVEFTTIKIEKPDTIVVYDGEYSGTTTPPLIDKVTLSVGERKTLRALARSGGHDLAGLLQYEWATDGVIVGVDSPMQGKATITAKKAGTATLTVTGGTFTQEIPVEVSQ